MRAFALITILIAAIAVQQATAQVLSVVAMSHSISISNVNELNHCSCLRSAARNLQVLTTPPCSAVRSASRWRHTLLTAWFQFQLVIVSRPARHAYTQAKAPFSVIQRICFRVRCECRPVGGCCSCASGRSSVNCQLHQQGWL
jgi:hypothetical protein